MHEGRFTGYWYVLEKNKNCFIPYSYAYTYFNDATFNSHIHFNSHSENEVLVRNQKVDFTSVCIKCSRKNIPK